MDTLTPFELNRIQINDLIERASKVRSEKIHRELERLNMSNRTFEINKNSIDMYV